MIVFSKTTFCKATFSLLGSGSGVPLSSKIVTNKTVTSPIRRSRYQQESHATNKRVKSPKRQSRPGWPWLESFYRETSKACSPLAWQRRPPWRQLRGKWMVSLVNSCTNATSKKWHLCEIDTRFALNSTPGWVRMVSSPMPTSV